MNEEEPTLKEIHEAEQMEAAYAQVNEMFIQSMARIEEDHRKAQRRIARMTLIMSICAIVMPVLWVVLVILKIIFSR